MRVNLIRERMKEKHFGNKELSELSGVPLGTLNKILCGETKDPSYGTMAKIANALDMSTDDFADNRIKDTDYEVTKYLRMIKDNEDYKLLIDSSIGMSEEDLKVVVNLMERLKKGEK